MQADDVARTQQGIEVGQCFKTKARQHLPRLGAAGRFINHVDMDSESPGAFGDRESNRTQSDDSHVTAIQTLRH